MKKGSFSENTSVARDLHALVDGDVLSGDIARQLYSTAACIYEVTPLIVIAPEHSEDVRKVVEYSSQTGIPITARGAGSGLAGSALGTGIILDFTKHMNRILKVEEDTVTVQPGMIYGRLNRALRSSGLHFPPDPSSGDYCSIGGMLGTNGAGAHSLMYGATKDWVDSLQIVTADAKIITANRRSIEEPDKWNDESAPYYRGALGILQPQRELLEQSKPQVNKNACGYNVFETLSDGHIDLHRLLVGSEGTLAVVTEAKLKLAALPASRGVALVSCASLERAGDAIVRLMELTPAALDLIDERLIKMSLEANPGLKDFIPEEASFILFAEFFGEDGDEVRAKLDRARDAVIGGGKPAVAVNNATAPEEMAAIWAVRLAAVAILNRVKGRRKPVAFAEDGTVHYSRLAEYVAGIYDIYRSLGIDGTAFGHAGNGNMHIRPMLDLRDERDVEKMRIIAERSHELAAEMKGTLTGEHADGLARTPYLKAFFGEVYTVFESVKQLFDPKGILNPGKIVTDEPGAVDKNLRYGKGYEKVETGSFLDEPDWAAAAELCHGCNQCDSYCPVALATNSESSSARAKANLLRGVLSGKLPADSPLDTDFKAVIDECVNCKLCLTDCPTSVDIPGLAQEARAFFVERMGSTMRDTLLGSTKQVSELSALMSPLTNLSLRLKPFRWAMGKALKLHPARRFQKFRRGSMAQRTFPHRSKGEREEVVYFAGCHANYSDPHGELRSTVALFEKLGVSVSLPQWRCCGVARLSLGQKKQAIEDAAANVRLLLPYVENNRRIIASSASCGLAIRMEYPQLLKTDEAKKVAGAVVDLHEYLGELERDGAFDGEWREVDMKVVYHEPCHLKAQKTGFNVTEMLKKIPGVELLPMDDSCCGIAGTFGYKSENFDLSMRMGEPLFDGIKVAAPDYVLTGCGTCQVQIMQGTGIPSIHPVTILNKSYSGVA